MKRTIRLLILCLTTVLAATDTKQDAPLSRISTPDKKAHLLNSIANNNFYSTTANNSAMPTENDVIIQQEHNLLGLMMMIVTRLKGLRSLKLSDLSYEVLTRLFAMFMSLIFGQNVNILWPQFINIAVPFLKLLTA
ncbi:unnamed protein product [Danaus chrysippus]|uniref:(African queen) hypothetical protein n=1 Tax=Danaus chrysippus TaxID=151541 RepID=A0A8J2VU03_9NEOP|nr:unnamed protein product [Danaus chrysippus]